MVQTLKQRRAAHTITGVTGTGLLYVWKNPDGAGEDDGPITIAQFMSDMDLATNAALTAGLAAKANTVHGHAIGDVTGLQTALDAKAAAVHAHAIGDVTGLQTALDAKAAAVHGHVIDDVTGLQTALDAKAAAVHGHVIDDVTGLQTALNSKQPLAAVLTNTTASFTTALENKLNSLDDEHFKGLYTTFSALTTAHPAANPGDYAMVDAGVGSSPEWYAWDDDDTEWAATGGGGAETPSSVLSKLLANADTNVVTDAQKARLDNAATLAALLAARTALATWPDSYSLVATDNAQGTAANKELRLPKSVVAATIATAIAATSISVHSDVDLTGASEGDALVINAEGNVVPGTVNGVAPGDQTKLDHLTISADLNLDQLAQDVDDLDGALGQVEGELDDIFAAVVSNMTALKALNGADFSNGDHIKMKRRDLASVGGGGAGLTYTYVSGSTKIGDDGLVVVPADGNGRFHAMTDWGRVCCEVFGVYNQATEQFDDFKRMVESPNVVGATIELGSRTINLAATSTITPAANLTLRGGKVTVTSRTTSTVLNITAPFAWHDGEFDAQPSGFATSLVCVLLGDGCDFINMKMRAGLDSTEFGSATTGGFLFKANDGGSDWTAPLYIHRSELYESWRCYFAVNTDTHVRSVIIDDNDLHTFGQSGIVLNQPGGGLNTGAVRFTNNRCNTMGLHADAEAVAFGAASAANVVAKGNTIWGPCKRAFNIEEGASDWQIDDNNINIDTDVFTTGGAAIEIKWNIAGGVGKTPTRLSIRDNHIVKAGTLKGDDSWAIRFINNAGNDPAEFASVSGNHIQRWEFGVFVPVDPDDNIFVMGNFFFQNETAIQYPSGSTAAHYNSNVFALNNTDLSAV